MAGEINSLLGDAAGLLGNAAGGWLSPLLGTATSTLSSVFGGNGAMSNPLEVAKNMGDMAVKNFQDSKWSNAGGNGASAESMAKLNLNPTNNQADANAIANSATLKGLGSTGMSSALSSGQSLSNSILNQLGNTRNQTLSAAMASGANPAALGKIAGEIGRSGISGLLQGNVQSGQMYSDALKNAGAMNAQAQNLIDNSKQLNWKKNMDAYGMHEGINTSSALASGLGTATSGMLGTADAVSKNTPNILRNTENNLNVNAGMDNGLAALKATSPDRGFVTNNQDYTKIPAYQYRPQKGFTDNVGDAVSRAFDSIFKL